MAVLSTLQCRALWSGTECRHTGGVNREFTPAWGRYKVGQFQQQAVSVGVCAVFVGVAQWVDDEAAAVLYGIDGLVRVPRNPAVKARHVNLVDEIGV